MRSPGKKINPAFSLVDFAIFAKCLIHLNADWIERLKSHKNKILAKTEINVKTNPKRIFTKINGESIKDYVA